MFKSPQGSHPTAGLRHSVCALINEPRTLRNVVGTETQQASPTEVCVLLGRQYMRCSRVLSDAVTDDKTKSHSGEERIYLA